VAATTSSLSAVAFGLASAGCWGAGDVVGGLATRKGSVYPVTVLSQVLGAVLLLALALITGEAMPAVPDIGYAMLAGIFGAMGVVGLYTALANGQMGVVSPVVGVVNAALPAVVGIATEGLPSTAQLVGFGFALTGVWFIARGDAKGPIRLRKLALPIGSGISLGLFFVFLARSSETSTIWPMIWSRAASISTICLFAAVARERLSPVREQVAGLALAGVLDAAGNAFFVLAAQAGRLDISSILAGLYPGGTVLLAWLVLKERLGRAQWVGIGAVLIALVLIAL
jgi:drug/metabolite transporter (DMT)-like permease